jgi:phage gp45-like
MGLLAELIKVDSTALSSLHGSAGKQVVVTGSGLGNTASKTEVFPMHGLFSRPPKGAKVVTIPLSGGKTRVAIGGVNYQIDIIIGEGGTIIYSTSADGKTVKAKAEFDNTGLIKISNESKSLMTILKSLINHISGMTSINCVSGSPVTMNPASIAAISADLVELGLLLKE